MKRHLLIPILALCLTLCTACSPITADTAPTMRTAYALAVEYNPANHTAYVKQRVRYVNGTGDALDELYFHVHANAYADPDNPPFTPNEIDVAYPDGFSPGALNMISAEVEGRVETGSFDTPTLYRFALDPPLAKDDYVYIDMNYELKLPHCLGRFGWGNNTASLANCFPQAAVFEDGAFRLDPYYAIGDPFYTECADWSATISVPDGYTVASTGALRDWVLQAPNVRDFCAVISDKFVSQSRKVGGTNVTVYGWDESFVDGALDTAAGAVSVFNSRFGRYPYESLSVAQADFLPGGMEYPGLAVVSSEMTGSLAAVVTAHEVAHQWWYAAVGSDQIVSPFQDEALAEFSTFLYFNEALGEDVGNNMMRLYGMRGEPNRSAPPVGASVTEFDSMQEYGDIVYGEGAAILRELRDRAGDKAFFNALKYYYSENLYKNAKPDDLIDAVEKHCGADIARWFKERLYWR